MQSFNAPKQLLLNFLTESQTSFQSIEREFVTSSLLSLLSSLWCLPHLSLALLAARPSTCFHSLSDLPHHWWQFFDACQNILRCINRQCCFWNLRLLRVWKGWRLEVPLLIRHLSRQWWLYFCSNCILHEQEICVNTFVYLYNILSRDWWLYFHILCNLH